MDSPANVPRQPPYRSLASAGFHSSSTAHGGHVSDSPANVARPARAPARRRQTTMPVTTALQAFIHARQRRGRARGSGLVPWPAAAARGLRRRRLASATRLLRRLPHGSSASGPTRWGGGAVSTPFHAPTSTTPAPTGRPAAAAAAAQSTGLRHGASSSTLEQACRLSYAAGGCRMNLAR